MKLEIAGTPHLTYCTNIHAGESWAEVRANLQHVAAVRARVAPHQPFGVGLRLSARAAEELAAPGEIEGLSSFLAANGLYVFTLNGFPYGAFHAARVKEAVYEPDWRKEARLAYTIRLADILADLLPPGVTGSVSTVPGAFRARVRSPDDVARMADGMLRAAARLHELHVRRGKLITLALEPEPCCHLETPHDAVVFFTEHLFGRAGVERFASLTGLTYSRAEEKLRMHLGVCFDACHMAVEFEEPKSAVDRLASAGIPIGKIQLSAGLEVRFDRAAELAPLSAFADDVYLHQVVEQRGRALTRHVDLPEAIADAASHDDDARTAARLWRIHYHVPIFMERLAPFRGTQPFLRELLQLLKDAPVSSHLEVETYTWDVLPPEHRMGSVVDSIARELHWVLAEVGLRARAVAS